ncbi:hypothetical protein A2U01_0065894, partial [Trifolium medium]|nr:hypothetical protein [Trifolium medium]
MSNSIDSVATDEQITVSSPKVQPSDIVAHAVRITTVPPQTSTKTRAKSSVKTEKYSK